MSKIVLFDVDGTLTKPRNKATAEMKAYLRELREKVTVGVVGGSDLSKMKDQIGEDVITSFDYVFSENGLDAFKDGERLAEQSLRSFLGDEEINRFVKTVLGYLSKLTIPVMRGTFIEFRKGMMNVSPIGRNCNQEERDAFEAYDKEHHIRRDMVAYLSPQFPKLKFSVGGQISFDVFPIGWDKTYCLRFLTSFDTIYFFGDKTYEGGNDYEIYHDDRVIGQTVTSPEDTMRYCKGLF